jgi:hypothetical protein
MVQYDIYPTKSPTQLINGIQDANQLGQYVSIDVIGTASLENQPPPEPSCLNNVRTILSMGGFFISKRPVTLKTLRVSRMSPCSHILMSRLMLLLIFQK